MMTWRKEETDVLVQQACQGDRGAQEELFERHRPQLLRLIRCRLDPRVQARVDESDVIQETFLLASRDLKSYRQRPGVPFYAWLRKIAWLQLLRTNEQHIHARGRSVLREQTTGRDHSHWALTKQLVTSSTPSMQLMGEELEQRVAVALEELSEGDRELLVLHYLERLNAAEIATILDITQTAYRVRLMRALERLRYVLGDIREEL